MLVLLLVMQVRRIRINRVRQHGVLKDYYIKGSGSMLQALRLHKRLIVVSNTSLMDNHQVELAQAMQQKNYCCCSTPK